MNTDRIAVVLVSARNPLNIGAAARAMANFGFGDLRVVNPYAIPFRQARSAVGADPILAAAREFDSLPAAIADCTLVIGTAGPTRRQPQHSVHTPAEAVPFIDDHLGRNSTHRAAILFGSEKTGLLNQQLSYCEWLLQIPTELAQPSMNLAQAVAVCLYELVRTRKPVAHTGSSVAASAADLERLTSVLTEALLASGYRSHPENRADTLRRFIHRLQLSAEDTSLLLGMLRQMLWKIHNPG
jgi:TrmH family RNA methyltransferase